MSYLQKPNIWVPLRFPNFQEEVDKQFFFNLFGGTYLAFWKFIIVFNNNF